MSSVSPREYEFNEQQNQLIGGLAGRMRGVGFFHVFIAILNLLVGIAVVIVIYRAKLPQDYVDTVVSKVGQAAHTDLKKQLETLPPDNHLWGIVISCAVNFLLYLMIGLWTQNAGSSFQKIVETRGSDVSHLMDALSSLNKMYTLIYTLILLSLLVLIVGLGLVLYLQFTR